MMVPKFRAWDKIREIYLYNVQDAYDALSAFVKYDDGENADYDECCFGEFLTDERYDIEQFTGLKDADGKEIYEDDVLENPKYRSVVKFESGSFYADVIGAANRFTLAGEWQTSVVIGNVHTNPELLEAQHDARTD